jgi:hypothetical protein
MATTNAYAGLAPASAPEALAGAAGLVAREAVRQGVRSFEFTLAAGGVTVSFRFSGEAGVRTEAVQPAESSLDGTRQPV